MLLPLSICPLLGIMWRHLFGTWKKKLKDSLLSTLLNSLIILLVIYLMTPPFRFSFFWLFQAECCQVNLYEMHTSFPVITNQKQQTNMSKLYGFD